MPPRYAYWTIIAGGLPTAFRAADRDELLPTFQRIREKHPDAEMKWFARGKLWASPEEARGADRRGGRSQPRTARSGRDREPRTRDWRPGGEHRDPRQKFIDAKQQRNASRRQERWQRKNTEGGKGQAAGGSGGPAARPKGNRPSARAQGTEEPQPPPRPRGPNREPPPNEEPAPTPPPRPDVPDTPPPGPPERGSRSRRPFRGGGFRKGPRR